MSNAEDWYVSSGTDKRGPMSFDKLKELAKQGAVTRGHLVWVDGMQQWQPASTVNGLFAAPPPVQPIQTDLPQRATPKAIITTGSPVHGDKHPSTLYEIKVKKDILTKLTSQYIVGCWSFVVTSFLLLLMGYWLWAVIGFAVSAVALLTCYSKRNRIAQFGYCIRDNVLQISEPPIQQELPLDTIVSATVVSLPIAKVFGRSAETNERVVITTAAGRTVSIDAVIDPREVSQMLLSKRR